MHPRTFDPYLLECEAQRLATHWMNGNRTLVLRDLADAERPPLEAAAIVATMLTEVLPGEYHRDFVGALRSKAAHP